VKLFGPDLDRDLEGVTFVRARGDLVVRWFLDPAEFDLDAIVVRSFPTPEDIDRIGWINFSREWHVERRPLLSCPTRLVARDEVHRIRPEGA
jgi:hypothetical protein